MTISMHKNYKTRRGELVRLLCVDAEGTRPVVGLIKNADAGADVTCSWTADGRIMPFNKSESACDLIEIQPYEEFEIDEPVMVRSYDGDKWWRRHFAGVSRESGLAMVWVDGKTSFTTKRTNTWNQCRRPTLEEKKTSWSG